MKKILLAGISTVGILAAGVAFAQASSTGAQGASAGTAGAASGAIAGSRSLSGAQAQGIGIGAIGDNINSRSESNAEPAIAPNLAGLYASPHTCMGSSTASVGVGGVFSAGAGSTWQDNECNKREAVKLAAQLGLKQAAAAVFYDIDVVKGVIGVAENADLRAQQEAQQLAGIKMSARAATPATVTATGETVRAKSNRPFWCDNTDSTNARWNECVD